MTSQARPKVDFSKVSLGSLKRYQAVYGLIDSDEALDKLVTDHFGGCCYAIMPPSKDIGEKYTPRTLCQVAENAPCRETRSADEAVDFFLKVRKDDKLEEQGIRKSARNRDKQEKKSA